MRYTTAKVGDLDIFYREAGPTDAPTVLLLHGFPTSSQMFRNLIPALADRHHLVAPDYPGFGHSSMPPRSGWERARPPSTWPACGSASATWSPAWLSCTCSFTGPAAPS